ncbi:conserved unknown protein [Ectocarpus siliculosus]|uniref:DWNN domain-containing protein n=1 Tax=Ectocarpus siliculosus TaxID=2880 RepID=D8LMD4_ECTSI|nr:conserved unknown protein [Ectocarpus siliculosus]|eukprot:CBN77544.1 conserved unknown protein [Ectocarpus siliculosus]
MASMVKFKFKSAREYDSVSFPGTGIKLLDLKRAIVEQKKLHQGMEFDLNIVNDKTREVQAILTGELLSIELDITTSMLR